ncbi:MAG: 2'-5' RNA ligase [Alphaproteobacteria bacterium]|nr:2'-5' RNA ligase [Alphaproteobacteria bacterium]
MFKAVNHISDIQSAVEGKKEIKFFLQPNGVTLGCYMYMDKDTFDTLEALECRGICFDAEGKVISRPLHKFFNVGEKEWLLPEKVMARDDVVGIYDKLDGSMLATALVDGKQVWRSKQSFVSDVVKLTDALLENAENSNISKFANEVAQNGMTACFELTHPDARIIVAPDKPRLRLLHVRDNVTGAYLMLDPQNAVHDLIAEYDVEVVQRHDGLDIKSMLATLDDMVEREGYVIQFANGDMAKVKCPWYRRLHGAVSMLRERDIARLALENNLDDVKAALTELGIDLEEVNGVETRLKDNLTDLWDEIEKVYLADRELDRKSFAIKHKEHPLFGLIMRRYAGQEPDVAEWYGKRSLRDDFSLRALVYGALAESIEG